MTYFRVLTDEHYDKVKYLCKDVYDDLVHNSNLISINGYKVIVKHEGDFASIMCIDEIIDSINAISDYCLIRYNCNEVDICITNPTISLLEDLKSHNFECLDELVHDCLYFTYK